MTKTYYVTVELSAEEIQALQEAREYVRRCMAHTHPWVVRDTGMVTIGKMLAAAQEHSHHDQTVRRGGRGAPEGTRVRPHPHGG